MAKTDNTSRSFFGEVRDAVSGRAALLVIGVLAIQLGFIGSYIAAFHHPTPHRAPIAVVAPQGAPAGTAAQTASKLKALPGKALDPRTLPSEASARDQIGTRKIDGALILGTGRTDQLLVASGGGSALSEALKTVLTQAESGQQRKLTVTDIRPATANDGRGLSAFYLVVGWVVGGYLVASLLGISAGSRPANRPRALVRLGALALYAIASGLGGAILVGTVFGALVGNFVALWWFGALVVFAVGAFTMALQVLAGTLGIGLTIILFVVLGNPSAGGPYPAPLEPAFFRAIGQWLPPGAGTSAVRGIAYFDGNGTSVSPSPCWPAVAGAAARREDDMSGRTRDTGIDAAVVAATLAELRSMPYQRLSVERIAVAAGVAKTSIYRRWPTKVALVGNAILTAIADPPADPADPSVPPADPADPADPSDLPADPADQADPSDPRADPSASIRERQLRLARHLRDVLAQPHLRRAIAGLLADAEDTELGPLRQRLLGLRTDPAGDLAADAVTGAIIYRALVMRLPIDDDYLIRLVETVTEPTRRARK
jgi:AcrR family transcriptional regulator